MRSIRLLGIGDVDPGMMDDLGAALAREFGVPCRVLALRVDPVLAWQE
jgi:hypothetical protein